MNIKTTASVKKITKNSAELLEIALMVPLSTINEKDFKTLCELAGEKPTASAMLSVRMEWAEPELPLDNPEDANNEEGDESPNLPFEDTEEEQDAATDADEPETEIDPIAEILGGDHDNADVHSRCVAADAAV